MHLYSMVGDIAEVPAADVLFRQVALHGWWLNAWLASLTLKERQAALQARAWLSMPAASQGHVHRWRDQLKIPYYPII